MVNGRGKNQNPGSREKLGRRNRLSQVFHFAGWVVERSSESKTARTVPWMSRLKEVLASQPEPGVGGWCAVIGPSGL